MAELVFTCLDVRPERYGAGPRLLFRLGIAESTGEPIHSIALRCQIRIQPQRREYQQREEEVLEQLFGGGAGWGKQLRPMQFATVSALVPAFVGSTEIELPVACTYDMEVASGQYFRALGGGVVPLVLSFSGTICGKGESEFWVQQMPWDQQATYPMPIRVWDELMEFYFPRSQWIRLQQETAQALLRYRRRYALPTWDAAIDRLLEGLDESGNTTEG